MSDISIGYTGQRRSGVSGHYLLGNGYRGFNPVLKRFAGQDSMSPFGTGGEHGFGYCGSNPINLSDPSGHIPVLKQIRKLSSRIARFFTESAVETAENDASVALSSVRRDKLFFDEGTALFGESSTDLELNTEEEFFLGYHGTSREAATNIMKDGPNRAPFFVTNDFGAARTYAEMQEGRNGAVLRVTTNDLEFTKKHAGWAKTRGGLTEELRISEDAFPKLSFKKVTSNKSPWVEYREHFLPEIKRLQNILFEEMYGTSSPRMSLSSESSLSEVNYRL